MESDWGNTVNEVWTWDNCGGKILRLASETQFRDGIGLLGYLLRDDGTFEDGLAGGRPLDAPGDVRRTQYLYAILTYYSDAPPVELAGKLVKFNQLDGGIAKAKFSEELEGRLRKLLDIDVELVQRLVREKFGGREEEYGDSSFSVEFLPRLPVYFVYHAADEEDGFESEMRVFFDATANHYLPTEICDYLVEIFVTRLEEEFERART
ncbi:MAG: DUF3786 domain-containing protein [Promethearchaeota archaeon]